MHPEHETLLSALKAASRRPDGRFDPQAYLRTGSSSINVTVPERRRIAREWLAAQRDAPQAAVLEVVESLLDGDSHEEKTLALLIVERLGQARRGIGPAEVDRWLDRLVGWAEVDSLCQSVFGAGDLLSDWPAWQGLIRRLARDANINKRRAALVLLTRPVRQSDDGRLSALAFETIETLKAERAIIVAKAVSWLLRSLTERHASEVRRYVDAQAASLPAVAVGETRRKLDTGRK